MFHLLVRWVWPNAYAEEICAEFDNFGLMVDLSHLPIIHESARQALIPVKDYIAHAHMGNCMMKDKNDPAYGDTHPRFGYAGGENDVEELVEYLRVLMEIGYLDPNNRRILSFEVKPVGDEDPDIVVANAKRVMNIACGDGVGPISSFPLLLLPSI